VRLEARKSIELLRILRLTLNRRQHTVHQLPQEVADFYLLTSYGALPIWKALLLNFLTGTSVIIGCIIVLSCDVSDVALGVLLAMGGGIYVQIACCEGMSRASRLANSMQDRLVIVFSFTFAAVIVGLVLLNHEHC